MAIQYLGTTISGVSGDTKPTLTANEKGVIFVETDTNKIYQWDTDSWNLTTAADATTSAKGVASFSGDNFAVSSGAVTIKNDGVILGTETTGNYIATIAGTSNQITVSGSGSETAGVTLSIPTNPTLPGNVTVSGDFTVSGDTTTVNTATLAVEDPLVSLATGNNSSDAVDIGMYGLYDTSGSQDLYGGLFRDANDSGKWKLFKDLQAAPTTTVNVSGTGYAVGSLVANLEGNVTGNVSGTAPAGTLTGNTLNSSVITSSLTTVGALNVGSITAGFTSIDVGSGAITTTGTVTGGQLIVDNITLDGNTITATSGAVNITPAGGSAIVLDGTINVDAGVVTGATSITSTRFIGAIDGVLGGNTPAAITATTGTFSGVIDITDATDSSDASGDTGALRTEGGASIAKKLYVGTDLAVDGTSNLDNTDIDGTLVVDGSNISLDSTSTLNIDNSNTSNGITIATATSGVPISIGHSTSETTINDNLTVTGTVDIGGGAIDGTTIGASSPSTIVGTTIDATTDFTIGNTVITDGSITDNSGLILTATGATGYPTALVDIIPTYNAVSGSATGIRLNPTFTDNNGDVQFGTHIKYTYADTGTSQTQPSARAVWLEDSAVTGSGNVVTSMVGLWIDNFNSGASSSGTSLYIEGGGTYAIHVDAGTTRLDGPLSMGDKISATSGALNIQDRLFINNNGSQSLWYAPGGIAIISDDNDNQTDCDIIFGTNSTTTASGMDELMRITDEGFVGIGTTPTRTLEVNSGTANVVARFMSSDTVGFIEIMDNSSNTDNPPMVKTTGNIIQLLGGTSSGNAGGISVAADGNVGIGVSDPDATLEVAGQIKITGGSPGADKILTSNADGLATWEDASSGGGANVARAMAMVFTV